MSRRGAPGGDRPRRGGPGGERAGRDRRDGGPRGRGRSDRGEGRGGPPRSRRDHALPKAFRELDQLEGRNVVVEALWRQRRRVVAIYLDERARPDAKVTRIQELAAEHGVTVKRVPRQHLDELCIGGVHNGVLAWAEELPAYTIRGLLSELEEEAVEPCIVLVDEASYEHNLGAVMRSALGAGVHGVVVPTRRGKGLSPVVHRVSMGGAEGVPLIREGLSSSLATLRRAGVRTIGCDMDGDPLWDVDLTGPVAIVLGGEGKGLSPTLRQRCDQIAAVPLQGQLESLNLSVTASVFLFERVRQLRELAAQRAAAAAPLAPGDRL